MVESMVGPEGVRVRGKIGSEGTVQHGNSCLVEIENTESTESIWV